MDFNFETLAVRPFCRFDSDGVVRPARAANLRARSVQKVDFGVLPAGPTDRKPAVAVVLSHHYSRSATVLTMSPVEALALAAAILEAYATTGEAQSKTGAAPSET